jgi:hypothetical protein
MNKMQQLLKIKRRCVPILLGGLSMSNPDNPACQTVSRLLANCSRPFLLRSLLYLAASLQFQCLATSVGWHPQFGGDIGLGLVMSLQITNQAVTLAINGEKLQTLEGPAQIGFHVQKGKACFSGDIK